MTILILTHDQRVYSIIVLTLLSLSSSNTSQYFFSHFFKNNSANTIALYALVQFLLVTLFAFTSNIMVLFSGVPTYELEAVLVGLIAGLAYVLFEKFSFRRYVRTFPDKKVQKTQKIVSSIYSHRLTGKIGDRFLQPIINNEANPYIKKLQNCSLFILIVIAICEEIVFRGFLTEIAIDASSITFIRWLLLGIFIFFFGMAHIFLGWMQVTLKMIFGFLSLVSYFSKGTILAPITMHVLLNYCAYREIQKTRKLNGNQ